MCRGLSRWTAAVVIDATYRAIDGIDWPTTDPALHTDVTVTTRRLPPLVAAAELALAALVLSTVPASGQANSDFSVTVTERSELVEQVGTTRRIGREEIEARNARTLDEALQLVPGLYIRTGGDGTPRIDVRGFRSRHVLLLINGVQVNATSDGQFDPARISTESIREIKVSYGSSSILYGDNTLAGVIEITTLDGQPDARVDVSAGTPDQHRLGGRFARTIGAWSLTGSASGYDSDGYRLPGAFTPTALEDGGRRQNSDRRRGDLRGAVGYRLSPSASFATEWSVGTGSYGVPGSVIADTTDIFAQTPRFDRVDDYRVSTGQVSLVVAPWKRFNLRAWVYRNAQREDSARYDDATYASMENPLVSGTFRTRERTTVTGSSALGRLNLSSFGSLRLVINQRRESFASNGVIRDVTIAGTGGAGGAGTGGGRGGGSSTPTTFGVRSFTTGEHVEVYSSGVEWEARPMPRLGTVVGAAANMQQRPGADADVAPTWLAGLSYDATSALRLHMSATRKIRVPSIDQLFDTAAGNPLLRAEHAYGVDLGGDYQLDANTSIGLSAFATNAYDFIERPPGGPFENQDRYRFRGGELTVQTARVPRVRLQGAYSFLDSENAGEAGTPPLQTRPRHRSSLEWIWTPVAGTSMRGAASYTGLQFYDARSSAPVQMRAGGYGLVDVGFTQTLAGQYDIAVDVSNLFDHLYDQSYGLPREGRAAVLTLRAHVR